MLPPFSIQVSGSKYGSLPKDPQLNQIFLIPESSCLCCLGLLRSRNQYRIKCAEISFREDQYERNWEVAGEG